MRAWVRVTVRARGGGESEGCGEGRRVQRTSVHEGCPVLLDVREGQPAALDPQRPHSRLPQPHRVVIVAALPVAVFPAVAAVAAAAGPKLE